MARVLWEEQVRLGHTSRFHTTINSDLRTHPFSAPLHTAAAALDQYGIKAPGFDAPISLMRDRMKDRGLPNLEGVDVLHLHGINGLVGIDAIASDHRSLRIVWTLHDMNPFTGVCHYSLGCQGFQRNCDSCPAVRPPFQGAVSKALARKRDALAALGNLTVVTPSRWLADQAHASSVFAGHDIVVQQNPLSPGFEPPPTEHTNRGEHPFRAVVIAKNLDDPVKNVAEATRAFQQAFPAPGAARLHLVGKGGASLKGTNIHGEGEMSPTEIAGLLRSTDVLIVASLAENSPLVIPEAASQGCAPLVANVGGMPELIATLGGGAVFSSPSELSGALNAFASRTATDSNALRKKLMTTSQKVFSPRAVVMAYDKVYAR